MTFVVFSCRIVACERCQECSVPEILLENFMGLF